MSSSIYRPVERRLAGNGRVVQIFKSGKGVYIVRYANGGPFWEKPGGGIHWKSIDALRVCIDRTI